MAIPKSNINQHKPYVYAFHIENLIKIGCTKSLRTRMQAYKNKYPFFQVIGISRVLDCVTEEDELKSLMGKPMKGREWFEWTAEKEQMLLTHFKLINPKFDSL